MIRCVSCGADNHSFASFCIDCGEPFNLPLSSPTSEHAPASAPTLGEFDSGLSDRSAASDFRRWARRETVLGVLVLVAALGFALYSWARDTEQSDAYQAGLAAQQARDWDRAAAEFRRAGDHPGAVTALSNAATQVYERDRLYSDAQEAARREDWRTAARALERVEGIQPDYKNTSRMLQFARERAQAADLSGVIFLQGDGGTLEAGLYVMDAAGRPTLLPGSDEVSRVRARSPEGRLFVYDRPRRYDDYPVTGPGSGLLPSAFSDHTIRRIPVLVTLTSQGAVVTEPLPMLDGEGRGVLGAMGLWWTRDSTGQTLYVPIGTSSGTTEAAPVGKQSERLLALDPMRDRAIFSREVAGHADIVGHDAPASILWMEQPVAGRVPAASVSPDGRWLLFLTEQDSPGGGRDVWVLPLDRGRGAASDRPVLMERAAANEVGEVPALRAAFVPSGEATKEVIVERTVEGRSILTIYRLDTRTVTHRWTGAGTGDLGLRSPVLSNGGTYLAVRRQYSNASILEVTRLTRPSYVTSWYAHFPAPADLRMLAGFTPADDFVLVGVEQTIGDPGISLFSAQFGGRAGLGRLIRLGAAAPSEQLAYPTVATLPDPASVLIVSPDGALRVAPASGATPAHLESGVRAVWSLRQPAVTPWIGD